MQAAATAAPLRSAAALRFNENSTPPQLGPTRSYQGPAALQHEGLSQCILEVNTRRGAEASVRRTAWLGEAIHLANAGLRSARPADVRDHCVWYWPAAVWDLSDRAAPVPGILRCAPVCFRV